MKVTFQQSGGFAGLIRGCILDTDSLPPGDAEALDRPRSRRSYRIVSERAPPEVTSAGAWAGRVR